MLHELCAILGEVVLRWGNRSMIYCSRMNFGNEISEREVVVIVDAAGHLLLETPNAALGYIILTSF